MAISERTLKNKRNGSGELAVVLPLVNLLHEHAGRIIEQAFFEVKVRLNLNFHIDKSVPRLYLHVQNAELVIITLRPEIGIKNADIGGIEGHFQNGTEKACENTQMLAEHSLENMVVDRGKQLLFHDLNITIISAKHKKSLALLQDSAEYFQ